MPATFHVKPVGDSTRMFHVKHQATRIGRFHVKHQVQLNDMFHVKHREPLRCHNGAEFPDTEGSMFHVKPSSCLTVRLVSRETLPAVGSCECAKRPYVEQLSQLFTNQEGKYRVAPTKVTGDAGARLLRRDLELPELDSPQSSWRAPRQESCDSPICVGVGLVHRSICCFRISESTRQKVDPSLSAHLGDELCFSGSNPKLFFVRYKGVEPTESWPFLRSRRPRVGKPWTVDSGRGAPVRFRIFGPLEYLFGDAPTCLWRFATQPGEPSWLSSD